MSKVEFNKFFSVALVIACAFIAPTHSPAKDDDSNGGSVAEANVIGNDVSAITDENTGASKGSTYLETDIIRQNLALFSDAECDTQAQVCATHTLAQQQFTSSSYPDTINKKRLSLAIAIQSGTYIGLLYFLNNVWYKDRQMVPFHFYDDLKGYLQIDKWGHAYGAYRISYAAYYALRQAGVSKRKAMIYGGPIGLIFQTPIEVFDGLYEGWGFSWTDMLANALGSALFMAQEAIFDEQVFLMKFSYSPSEYPQYHSILGESYLESFFLDYNAHTYWLSGNIRKITRSKRIPSWLNVAMGYSANGLIGEFENPTAYMGKSFPKLERHRQYILSLDIDFSKIPTNKKWLKDLFSVLNLIKIPFPGIEYNKVDKLKFRPIYF